MTMIPPHPTRRTVNVGEPDAPKASSTAGGEGDTQLALFAAPRPRPARWYRHAPACWLPLDERKGPFRVLGRPHRWWELYQAELIRRFLDAELELGERVAARLTIAGGA